MNFGEAVVAMRRGESVRRAFWVANNVDVRCMKIVPAEDVNQAYIAWLCDDGTWAPATFSHVNVLAEDWEVLTD